METQFKYSRGIKEEIKSDFGNLRDLSMSLLQKGQFKTALNGLQICWAADSTATLTIVYISGAYILNNQYDNSKRIIEKWKNEPLIGYAGMSTYADGFLALIIYLENSGITHPDFAKAKELLKKK
jgi:hypothetical protein